MKVKLLLDLPRAVEQAMAEHFDLISDGDFSLEAIEAAQADAIICSPAGLRLDREAIERLPSSVRAIGTYSVGYDHIDLAAAKYRGVAVFNTPDVLSKSVAEVAMFLLLGAARRGTESIALIRSGQWTGWRPDQLLGTELAGKTMGILGMGSIGRQIALRARGFGMEIAYHNRRPSPVAEDARFVADPVDLMSQSDALVLCWPSTRETRGFVCGRTLAAMRPSSILINIGRGDLVCDDDLILALEKRHILAAGLDVFNDEPALDPRYSGLPNVFMTPHIGSSTMEARLGMAQALIDAFGEWRAGRHARNQIA